MEKIQKIDLKFDIILRNNASNEVKIYQGYSNESDANDYLTFHIDLDGLKDGEYTYAVIVNMRDDVTYTIDEDIKDSMVHTREGDIQLRHLMPFMGLLKIEGEEMQALVYEQRINNEGYSQNATIYFYKG